MAIQRNTPSSLNEGPDMQKSAQLSDAKQTGRLLLSISLNKQIMTLYQLINKVSFEDVFSDLLRHVPEVENIRHRFLLAFETLRSIKPSKNGCVEIEVNDKDYLGMGVHDIWVNASDCKVNIWEGLLAAPINRGRIFNRSSVVEKITDEQITADILWHLVAYGYSEESTALSGYLLNNRRFPESTQAERREEICSYIDNNHVMEICHEQIRKYLTAKNVSWIADMTSYSLPKNKAAYDITCFLDDFMWFNNETKTILIISASEGYESEVCKIKEFAHSMLKNPTIVYGKPILPGIEVMAIFITE